MDLKLYSPPCKCNWKYSLVSSSDVGLKLLLSHLLHGEYFKACVKHQDAYRMEIL